MTPFSEFAKILITLGVVFIFLGLLLFAAGKLPFLGRLPGDIYIKKGNFSFYFPLVTSIILSIILTILLNIFRR